LAAASCESKSALLPTCATLMAAAGWEAEVRARESSGEVRRCRASIEGVLDVREVPSCRDGVF